MGIVFIFCCFCSAFLFSFRISELLSMEITQTSHEAKFNNDSIVITHTQQLTVAFEQKYYFYIRHFITRFSSHLVLS